MLRGFRSASLMLVCLFAGLPASFAADGIRGSAIAVRRLPADTITFLFDTAERLDQQADAVGKAQAIEASLKAAGMRVLARGTSYKGINPGFGTSQSNVVSSEQKRPEAFDSFRLYSFTVAGFRRVEDVLRVLADHGIRRTTSFEVYSSNRDAAIEELTHEALKGAIEKARATARAIGVEVGDVVDMQTQVSPGFGTSAAASSSGTLVFDDTRLFEFGEPKVLYTTTDSEGGRLEHEIRVRAWVVLKPRNSAN